MVIEQAKEILKDIFGYSSFRPMQEKVIEAALNKKDCLVLMPTGGGKSICFQIPALALSGVTIVVSPLIALMKDQVEALKVNGVSAEYLNSSLSEQEQSVIIERLHKGDIKLLYVSPEKMNSESFYYIMLQVNVNLIAIDEAHCISSWGHDFRPDYKKLGYLKKQFKDVPIMALTATADPLTQNDIAIQLRLSKPKIFKDSFSRPNIFIEARPAYKRKEVILDFIQEREDESGIVYCLSKKNTEDLSRFLRSNGVSSGFYHAGMDPSLRNRVQNDFINDRIKVVCATIAFGMGIDKSNVRWVIHHNLPKNIEGYYQEIGRSGRDGMPAHALLFYGYQDYKVLSSFNEESERKVILNARLDRMLHFAESNHCRRKLLLNYFGEWTMDNCGECDNCKGSPSLFDGTVLAQKALSAVARLRGRLPKELLPKVMTGDRTPDVVAGGFDVIKTFGAGADVSGDDWERIVNQLVSLGYLKVEYQLGSILALTPLSDKVLFEGKTVMLHRLNEKIKRAKKVTRKKQITASSFDQEKGLFERLRQLRRSMAVEQGVPPYILFSDATLSEMVERRPTNEWEMKDISGVGNTKWERYGQAFVDEILAFMQQKNKKAVPVYMKTLELYKQGLSPEVIAARAGVNIITVYSHLATLFEKGEEVDIEQYVMPYELTEIEKIVQRNPGFSLQEIFEATNRQIPHHIIRLSMSLLKKRR
ncbi:DNA helicase RecQ [Saccharicrinis fermentans]|uniref:DNA helicase RecQ n=1 Tax=Saccharicrinis fermentans DSM 9555 = JCM 21142 TaxID=869213 RepID=W7YIS3_9BACT|nr:DNA helicase RecQ [Saccharicrinis fermentans]GAF04371.1 ATP-dependent DNA helicase RecQ [Saccharicrinis fermentans DSM 9555 = JCM 21142]